MDRTGLQCSGNTLFNRMRVWLSLCGFITLARFSIAYLKQLISPCYTY